MKLKATVWIGLSLTTIIVFSISLLEGGYLSIVEAWTNGNLTVVQEQILSFRLSRIFTAFLAGAVLSMAGFYIQALVHNPLADPYLMGVSSGAGFGVTLLTTGIIPFIGLYSIWFLPLIAFGGSLASLFLVLLLSRGQHTFGLLMAGIAVSSLFTALTGYCIYQFSDELQLRSVMFWTLGSFNRSSWEGVYTALICLGVSLIYGRIRSSRLDVLSLGGDTASGLGLKVKTFRKEVIWVIALTVGATTAFTGPIGFVGLMIPHFTRALLGASHRNALPFAALLGGTFLLACDSLAKILLPPAGLPVSIITSLLGIPFFLYLLHRKNNLG